MRQKKRIFELCVPLVLCTLGGGCEEGVGDAQVSDAAGL